MGRVLSRDLLLRAGRMRTRWCVNAPSPSPGRVYDLRMPSMPTILLALSLPAGAVGYAIAARVLAALPLPADLEGFVVLFGPLFIAGLVMLPFLVPFFDRKAKQDLAAHRQATGSAAEGGADVPDKERP